MPAPPPAWNAPSQALNLLVHAIAPLAFAGYLVAALRGGDAADAALRRSLAAQAAASLAGYLAVLAVSVGEHSLAPLGFYLATSAVWLSPLNPNWVWTSPHLSLPGSRQPTVSFYTPHNAFGAALDAYMGWENYHVEHHGLCAPREAPLTAL